MENKIKDLNRRIYNSFVYLHFFKIKLRRKYFKVKLQAQ